MDLQEPQFHPAEPAEERDTEWADLTERLRVLQHKYAAARLGAEPRSFATRFRD